VWQRSDVGPAKRQGLCPKARFGALEKSLDQHRSTGERKAGRVRYWRYGQAEKSPDLAISDLSRFLPPFLRQLILNPFEEHSPESRNIHNPDFLETLREFAAMDGAFVINHKGDVEFGGTYIDAPATEARLREGLGARHAAAAAITAATPAVAVVVSESSGDVTVFHKGQAILELEKPEVIVGPDG